MRNIETTMALYRAQLGRGAAPAEVSAQAAQITALFDRVCPALDGGGECPVTNPLDQVRQRALVGHRRVAVGQPAASGRG